ncbi:MAG: hypothetical protein H8D70_02730 [Rhodospirillaceae bacterium]|nr:hypothetical protein [Rhodospirillaceae bacterium]
MAFIVIMVVPRPPIAMDMFLAMSITVSLPMLFAGGSALTGEFRHGFIVHGLAIEREGIFPDVVFHLSDTGGRLSKSGSGRPLQGIKGNVELNSLR